MDEQAKRTRPTYNDDFKRDVVRLVVEEGYSFKAACEAVGVCDATLRSWHAQLAPPPEVCVDDATVEELQVELKRLRKQLKRTELEREILKKATAALSQQTWREGVVMPPLFMATERMDYQAQRLLTVLDLFSRKIVGWSMSDSLATPLVSEALRNAIEKRRPKRGKLLHHSDRGCQYTSDSYQKTLQTLGIECSMSRRGNCYDNAVADSPQATKPQKRLKPNPPRY